MYPPRKKPLTKSNTPRKSTAKKNTYKPQPKADRKGFSGWLIGAAVLGGLLAWSNVSGNSTVPQSGEAMPGGIPPAPTGGSKPSTTPAPAPVTTPPVVVAPAGSNTIYLVVNSWNGEGLYASTGSDYAISTGYGRDKITHLDHGKYVGIWNGQTKDNMLQAVVTISGVSYNVWIDAKEVYRFSISEYSEHKRKFGTMVDKTQAQLKDIINYFKN
ncbi:hypothetical protein [uncultured Pontibacter sp.]|uniref:hypothetical protein n=1 Tax=uncultured Pontibacter sp. TaxID=453356 RepID=UPI002603BAA6|nr:hypothetical protein [uncultured Pontibacter sp.]